MFCKEYLVDLNAKEAAIRAGYSENSAVVIGCENLTKPYLQERIQELMNKRSKKVEINADMVLGVILETMGKAKDKADFTNTYKGAELLGKHLKLFTDKVEVSGDVTFNVSTGINGSPNDG